MLALTVDNDKGGVAKTTTAYHAAVMAAAAGLRVVAFDNDTNRGLTNLMRGRGFHAHSQRMRDMLDVLSHPEEGIAGAAVPYDLSAAGALTGFPNAYLGRAVGKIDVVCGTRQLASAVTAFRASREVASLSGALPYVVSTVAQSGQYDLAIIDNAPGWDEITRSGLLAAQQVIVPIEPAPLSLDGLADYSDRVKEANTLRAQLGVAGHTSILGVLLSRYDAGSKIQSGMAAGLPASLQREGIPYFRDERGMIAIRSSDAVLGVALARKPAWAIDESDGGAQDLLRFGRALLAAIR